MEWIRALAMQMRPMILMRAFLAASLLAGCGSSSEVNLPAVVDSSPQARPANSDLLSVDGELLPLSSFFGVCVKYKGVWGAQLHSGPSGPHYPTGGEIIVEGGVKLKISVGKFGVLPGAVLKDVAATSSHRRIRVGRDRLDSFILVSDFENAGDNRVSIEYDEKDAAAEAAAIRLANDVVACHVSAVPASPKGRS